MLICAVGMCVSTLLVARTEASIVTIFVWSSTFAVILISWAFTKDRKAQSEIEKLFASFEIESSSDCVIRRQADLPEMRIQFADIQKAELYPGRYFVLRGKGREKIGIPVELEGFDELLEDVRKYVTVQTKGSNPVTKQLVIMATLMAAYLGALWSETPAISIPLNIVALFGIVGAFVYIRRNPNCSQKVRRTAFVYLLLAFTLVLKLLAIFGAQHSQ